MVEIAIVVDAAGGGEIVAVVAGDGTAVVELVSVGRYPRSGLDSDNSQLPPSRTV